MNELLIEKYLGEKTYYWEHPKYERGVYPRWAKPIQHAQKRYDSAQKRAGDNEEKFFSILRQRMKATKDIEKLRAWVEVLDSWNIHDIAKEAYRKYIQLGGEPFGR